MMAKLTIKEEDGLKAGLLKLTLVLKREPEADLDKVISDISQKNHLNRARFVEYIAQHREFITSTVKSGF
ncbi:MAG: hypothetical protein WC889_17040 [Myxococcota bacterium]|jgi:hypothetical protein